MSGISERRIRGSYPSGGSGASAGELASPIAVDTPLDVGGFLAGAELDDAELGETAGVEGIFGDDGLNLVAAVADREDDPAVARDFPARHQEVPRRVVLLQEAHVR